MSASMSFSPGLQVRCPGKVFILGEYSCLVGAPALIHTLEPKYLLDVQSAAAFKHNFIEGSPASKLLKKYGDVTAKYSWSFSFSEKTSLGTGSSTAEYLLTKLAISYLQPSEPEDVFQIRKEYVELLTRAEGIPPSGVDLIAQYTGGLTVVAQNQVTRAIGFSLNEQFALFYTGSKMKTHEHLIELKKQGFPHSQAQNLAKLAQITKRGLQAMEKEEALQFGECMNAYQATLSAFLQTSREYRSLIPELQALEGVLGCKGSGSQGGDCLIIFYKIEAVENLKKWALEEKKKHPKTELLFPAWTNIGKEFASSQTNSN